MAFYDTRDVATTLVCPDCGNPLHIGRTCHEVFMHCPSCVKRFPLADFIARADAAMERFLEKLYCDRI